MTAPLHPRRPAPTLGACAVAALLVACTVGPDFVRPTPETPERYTREAQAQATVAAGGQAQTYAAGTALPADWWRMFQSPAVDRLVQQALDRSATLQAAQAALRVSQDQLRAGAGVFYPQLSAGADATRARGAPISQGSAVPSTVYNVVTLSGTISYTLDVFGGERRTLEGLQAQVDTQRYAMQAAQLSLSANVVNACIARAAYAAEVRATEELIALELQQLHSTEIQIAAGTSPYSNLLILRSLIAGNRAALAALRQKGDQAAHLLAMLVGASPAAADLPDIELDSLVLPAQLPLSLPSDLVRQRPDILASEAQLHVASANVGVATAAMFPHFGLSGSVGAAGASLASLGSAPQRFWSLGPSMLAPLFAGGTLEYGRRAAIEAFDQQQANYRQTVLAAFEQVADTLRAIDHDAEALQAQLDSVHAAAQALALLQINYRAGLVDYLDVLTADAQTHTASLAMLDALAQRHQDTVALYAALGGGWWNAAPAAASGAAP